MEHDSYQLPGDLTAPFAADKEAELLAKVHLAIRPWGMQQPAAFFAAVRRLALVGGPTSADALVKLMPQVYASSDATFCVLYALQDLGESARSALAIMKVEARDQTLVDWAQYLVERLDGAADGSESQNE